MNYGEKETQKPLYEIGTDWKERLLLSIKKALVTLKEGDTIDFYSNI